MEVDLNSISKRYQFQWIFKDVSLNIKSGEILGISGRNGSGKSTLLKIIARYLQPTSGKLSYTEKGKEVPKDELYTRLGFVAPYSDLIAEFSLKELYNFHKVFRKLPVNFKSFREIIAIKIHDEKKMNELSSGMKQRVELALSLVSENSLVLLDEPTTFLDKHAKTWFYNLISQYALKKTIVIASNDPEDFTSCDQIVEIESLQRIS